MNLPSKKFWFSVLFFLVLVGGLAGAIILVGQRQIFEKKAVGGADAALELISNLSVGENEEFDVPVMVNTDGVQIVGADVIINFDKNFLRLVNIIPRPENSGLKTYLPLNESGGFDSVKVISEANQTGRIEFGAVAWAADSSTQGFNGVLGLGNPLATLRFKALQVGQTTANFVFSSGSTLDSNLVNDSAVDILARVTNLSLNITLSATTTPTVTSAPTPTPEPGKANLTFKIKFQGISSQKPDKTVKVILKKEGAVTGTFADVPVISDSNGIYTGTIPNIAPDIYEVLIKGWVHLQGNFGSVTLNQGENSQDWSGTILKAGDIDGNNLVNAVDIARVIQDYFPDTPANSPADFNLDGTVNAVDIGFIIGSYFQTGEQ